MFDPAGVGEKGPVRQGGLRPGDPNPYLGCVEPDVLRVPPEEVRQPDK